MLQPVTFPRRIATVVTASAASQAFILLEIEYPTGRPENVPLGERLELFLSRVQFALKCSDLCRMGPRLKVSFQQVIRYGRPG